MSASFQQCVLSKQPTECGYQRSVSRSPSECSSQTLAGSCYVECTSVETRVTTQQLSSQDYERNTHSESCLAVSAPQAQQLGGWLEPSGPALTYLECAEMIRRHKLQERPAALPPHTHAASKAAGAAAADVAAADAAAAADGAARAVVVSWLVEVCEEYGLQQESLHASVALLDAFLASSAGVPRCVLQLVAVGCVFIATKQLEVHPPSVEQLVAVAAHSFTASDLLRVERVLLDALEFRTARPTPYGCLHLLTQVRGGGLLCHCHCHSMGVAARFVLS
eukprot:GHRQ01025502.1.p1 GENE.GHRQ01025502.1~~GHRQ01025502.1.p1  ORF type:complete len:279 (+),score=63.71 GHRQ01025502.1:180-1016(+)